MMKIIIWVIPVTSHRMLLTLEVLDFRVFNAFISKLNNSIYKTILIRHWNLMVEIKN